MRGGVPVFSFAGSADQHPDQVDCHIAYTNKKTHQIISDSLEQSPLFTGKIEGLGPRYCPSIEDKIVRFADKDSHQIFVEPEGLNTYEVYPNGISTSLPFEAQQQLVRSISGFEQAHIIRPGYAIEYDFFDPRDLHPWLETKYISGLFFAGQINGTTGYEEAAAQGLLAGINAALQAQEKESWYPKRSEAYLGVLVDDLITSGTQEPYRMFTSRAEYRLLLREDNADLRLTEIGRKLGLINDERWVAFNKKREAIEKEQQRLSSTWVRPDTEQGEAIEKLIGQPLRREYSLMDLLKRPNVNYKQLMSVGSSALECGSATEQVEIQAKYAGYISRQQEEIEKLQQHEETILPDNINYEKVPNLSNEVRQKLLDVKPTTIGQAARIPGMTPAAVSLLLIYLKKKATFQSEL